jgi:hypothetical protein
MFTNLIANQSTMEQFLKRKNPPGDDQNPDGGTSRRGGSVGNTNHTTLHDILSNVLDDDCAANL